MSTDYLPGDLSREARLFWAAKRIDLLAKGYRYPRLHRWSVRVFERGASLVLHFGYQLETSTRVTGATAQQSL